MAQNCAINTPRASKNFESKLRGSSRLPPLKHTSFVESIQCNSADHMDIEMADESTSFKQPLSKGSSKRRNIYLLYTSPSPRD